MLGRISKKEALKMMAKDLNTSSKNLKDHIDKFTKKISKEIFPLYQIRS